MMNSLSAYAIPMRRTAPAPEYSHATNMPHETLNVSADASGKSNNRVQSNAMRKAEGLEHRFAVTTAPLGGA
jgi:hypothetical protein